MKLITAFIFTSTLIFALTSCGEKEATHEVGQPAQETSTQITDSHLYANPEAIKAAAEKGDASATTLAVIISQANAGDANGQYGLASLYRDGTTMKKDLSSAFQWAMKAAEQGHSGAQFLVGTMYLHGESVPANKESAIQWFSKSAANGHPIAKQVLADLKNSK